MKIKLKFSGATLEVQQGAVIHTTEFPAFEAAAKTPSERDSNRADGQAPSRGRKTTPKRV